MRKLYKVKTSAGNLYYVEIGKKLYDSNILGTKFETFTPIPEDCSLEEFEVPDNLLIDSFFLNKNKLIADNL